jgi:xanthine dehydrogenase accessory factor
MPRPHLVVIGRSPAVTALARMAAALDWRATVVDDGGSRDEWPQDVEVFTTLDLGALDVGGGTFVVVATQGHYDEAALEAALRTEAGHIGLVASRKRADGVLEYLRSRGLDDEALARIRAPAGLDLGSLDHVEIAVAVLAELVALRAGGGLRAGVAVVAPLQAIDPVCEMTVDVATARYVTAHEGQDHYFCAAGCQRAFEEQPQRFLAPKDATN